MTWFNFFLVEPLLFAASTSNLVECLAHTQSGLLHCFGLTNDLFLLQSVQLERLALYHDSNRLPWEIDKRWEDISPREWIEVLSEL